MVSFWLYGGYNYRVNRAFINLRSLEGLTWPLNARNLQVYKAQISQISSDSVYKGRFSSSYSDCPCRFGYPLAIMAGKSSISR